MLLDERGRRPFVRRRELDVRRTSRAPAQQLQMQRADAAADLENGSVLGRDSLRERERRCIEPASPQAPQVARRELLGERLGAPRRAAGHPPSLVLLPVMQPGFSVASAAA